MAAAADRNLLFGLLALQNGLIDQDQLVAAFRVWSRDKSRQIAEYLVDRGELDTDQRSVVQAMVGLHEKKHGDSTEKSLASIPTGRSTRESLAALGDAEIDGTLAHVGSGAVSNQTDLDSDRTSTYSVGTATSDGQRFRILRPHAKGGLGAVFVALDAELNREVALKQILDSHADDPTSRTRFVLKAEITGGLEHPGIVPVYGLGSYGDGRPYYAMRFVRGDSLKDSIAAFRADTTANLDHGRHSLALRKLMRRFTDVCNAIEYAHTRGVIHRDIKPANVIVGKYGETLVVDWGLAKPIGRADPASDDAERTLVPSSASGSAETLPGSALGTPAYMSPEQARGDLDRLGPGSDVYALGATLYCLLTGRPPFESDDIGELLRKVQRGEFAPPRQLDASIDPALEAVCLKAMALKPEDRYSTSRALADDVERWMADLPVTAWREPLGRQIRRWARRNRTAVTALAASVLVALAGTGAVLAVQTNANGALQKANSKLAIANDREKERFSLAMDAIKLFHGEVSEDLLLKEQQFEGLRTKLLKGAADFYGRLENLLKGQTDRESRAALGKAYDELGELTKKIGDQTAALVVQRKALAVRRALASEPGADAASKIDVARSLNATGWLQRSTGDFAGARAAYTEASHLAKEAETEGGAAEQAQEELGRAYHRIAIVLAEIGDTSEALANYDKALAIRQKLADANPAVTQLQQDLAMCHNNLGLLLVELGDTAGARASYGRALAIRQKLADANSKITLLQQELAISHLCIGALLNHTGDMAGAQASYRQSLAISQRLADANPSATQFQRDLTLCHVHLGELLSRTGDTAGAKAAYASSLAILQRLADSNPTVTQFQQDLAKCHINIGSLLSKMGDPAGGLVSCDKALAILQTLADANPAVTEFQNQLASAHLQTGMLLWQAGRPGEDRESYRRAQAIYQKLADTNPAITYFRTQLAWTYNNIGYSHSLTGKPGLARESYRRAQEIAQKLADDNPSVTDFRRSVAHTLDNIGNLWSQMGKPDEAMESYRRALEIQQNLALANPNVTDFQSSIASSFVRIGWLLAQSGELGKAMDYFALEEPIWKRLADANPTVPEYQNSLANCLTNIANVLLRKGRTAEARARCDRAVALREVLVSTHPNVPEYRQGLAESLCGLGLARRAKRDFAGASADWRRAIALYKTVAGQDGECLFFYACCHASLSSVAGLPGTGMSDSARDAEADRAVALLVRAVEVGYSAPYTYRNEPALDPLRDRPDFQLLMLDLAYPSDPFARGL
jgi:eukaryotic-like serine/threonine-protein kinase